MTTEKQIDMQMVHKFFPLKAEYFIYLNHSFK